MKTENHVERAKKAYKSFKVLKEKNLIEDAFSRGYYALLHLGFVMLIKGGEKIPKTHGGFVSRLWELREKLAVEEDLVKKISRFQSIRESGDYAEVPAVTKDDLKDLDEVIKIFFNKAGVKYES